MWGFFLRQCVQFHGGLWGGWQYQVAAQDAANQALLFSHGGYQEARGSGINSNHFYVENGRRYVVVWCVAMCVCVCLTGAVRFCGTSWLCTHVDCTVYIAWMDVWYRFFLCVYVFVPTYRVITSESPLNVLTMPGLAQQHLSVHSA